MKLQLLINRKNLTINYLSNLLSKNLGFVSNKL